MSFFLKKKKKKELHIREAFLLHSLYSLFLNHHICSVQLLMMNLRNSRILTVSCFISGMCNFSKRWGLRQRFSRVCRLMLLLLFFALLDVARITKRGLAECNSLKLLIYCLNSGINRYKGKLVLVSPMYGRKQHRVK